MTHIIFRSATLTPGAGRTVSGLLVPFGQVREVSDGSGRSYRERFEFGAFTRSIRERAAKVKLFTGPADRLCRIGVPLDLREEPDGLHAVFDVDASPVGEDVLARARSGTRFSVSFQPIRQHIAEDVVVRTEVALMKVTADEAPARRVMSVADARRRLELLDL